MSDTNESTEPIEIVSSATERFGEPGADRAPTPEEEQAAERARRDVDVDAVAEHYEEMTQLGKNVKGEGAIDGSN